MYVTEYEYIVPIFISPEDALRVDANISVRHTDADELGTRTEVKNIQSWKSLSKAIGKMHEFFRVLLIVQ